VPSVERALDILERLRAADRGQTLSELSKSLHLPKNAVFRITQTLLARGYLLRDPATMRFELSRQVLDLWQPRETIDRLALTASTDRTITSPDELVRECDAILARGYATDHAETEPGIHCVAAPICSADRGCVATIWFSAPARRLPKAAFRDVSGLVIEAGKAIGRRLDSRG
jgi:DNA-binding IclR family transcriptional regulator